MKLDTLNTDPKYWEAVLTQYKLGAEDEALEKESALLRHSDGEDDEVEEAEEEEDSEDFLRHRIARRSSATNRDFDFLRTKIDSNDQFMSGGHQIKKVRVHERKDREWAMSDSKIRDLINLVFPLWRTNPRQRLRAGRWNRIIHLYYRTRMSSVMVAEEMGVSKNTVRLTLNRMNRVISGRNTSNRGPLKRPLPASLCTQAQEST